MRNDTMKLDPKILLLLSLTGFAAVGCKTEDDGDDTDTDTDVDTDTNDTDDTDDTDTDDTEVPYDPCTTTGVSCNGTLATLSGEIVDDLVLKPSYQWVLSGAVLIGKDDASDTAVLTIDPGTVVYGTEGSFLAVSRGSQIFAEGTAADPIVFTSEATALGDDRSPAGWGGLVINGRAPINKCADPGCSASGEAGTGTFGGNMATDNSGVIKYVRIEFGGFDVLPDEELNGLTLAGVGSGTTLDYIQVHANDDDGFEFFGGTVNAKHLVATCVKDDAIDWDLGYSGKIQFAVAAQCAAFPETGDPNGIEADNQKDNNTATPISNPILSNITLLGKPLAASPSFGAVLRRGTAGELHNVVIAGFASGCLAVRDSASDPAMKNSIIDCTTDYEVEAPDTTEEDDMFEAAGSGNTSESPGLTQSSLTLGGNPDFRPSSASSAAATGGVKPADAFFDAVTFKGAFAQGQADWTDGWTDFSAN